MPNNFSFHETAGGSELPLDLPPHTFIPATDMESTVPPTLADPATGSEDARTHDTYDDADEGRLGADDLLTTRPEPVSQSEDLGERTGAVVPVPIAHDEAL